MIVFTIVDKDNNVETLKTSRTKLTVGGAFTDDITLQDQSVSPEHGLFIVTGEDVVYTDNGFGTRVNENEIIGESIPVTSEDRVMIGSFVVTYTLKQEEAFTTRNQRSSTSRDAGETSFQRSEPARPVPPTFPTPEAEPSQAFSDDTTSFGTPSVSGTIPTRPLPNFKQIRIPEEKKQEITYNGLAIFILVLMVFFWPLGFLANILAWKYVNRDAHNREGQPTPTGCISTLLVFNVIILIISLLVIGILIVTVGNQ